MGRANLVPHHHLRTLLLASRLNASLLRLRILP